MDSFVTKKDVFRIKPYAHLNYKFVVRAKLEGKWRRSYFKNKEEAMTYARDQNAAWEKKRQMDPHGDSRSDVRAPGPPAKNVTRAPIERLAIPARTVARKAAVILGMHRSGTSALCGALDLSGVDFGKHLMPANHANEKGYWEHEDIVRVHDDLLSSLGSRWDDDKPLPTNWAKRKITQDVRALLLGILERDFADSALFGIKDPRMCRLMPLWFPIFQTLRVEPRFVLTVRHPWEIAESLAKRDGIEHPKSYLLWLEHVVQAEIATRSHKRSFVRYEEMVDDPVAILGELRKQLGINLRPPSRVQPSLRDFLDPSMRHHKLNRRAGKLRPPVPQLALDLYETIRNASSPSEIARKVEPLVTQFIRGRELFNPLFYPRIDLVESQLGSLIKEMAKSKETRDLLGTLDTPTPLSAQILELNRVIDEKANQILHLQYEFDEKAKHVVLLQGELKAKSEQVLHLQHEFDQKAEHVVLLQGELKAKSEQVLHFQREAEEKSKQIGLHAGDLERKSKEVAQLKTEAGDKSRHITQFQRDLEERSAQVAHFQRESNQQSQLLERLKNQLETASDRLARVKDELLDARWEALTLRGPVLRKTDSAETFSARVLELENRVETTTSERDHLRAMLASLQSDLEQERLTGQSRQGELRAAQDQLNATQRQLKAMAKELRSEQKQMERLRQSISRKLILPFGRSQRKLQQLTASRRAND